jgi:hypothetical protein
MVFRMCATNGVLFIPSSPNSYRFNITINSTYGQNIYPPKLTATNLQIQYCCLYFNEDKILQLSLNSTYRWCNGKRACFDCGRSWVRARPGQTRDYKICICCFSAKHIALRSKNNDWLSWN